jgi:hypothetical protein
VAVEEFRGGGDELATLERWPNAFDELQTRVARHFLRPEVRGRVRRYLGALLGRVERKRTAGRWPSRWAKWDPKGRSAS